MIPYAVIVPHSRTTPDRRNLRWWECELHHADGHESHPMRPFWSVSEARSWAQGEGYEVRD
ncbi:MAG: hypothetical protein IBJ02_04810 [Brevundimonas sp.]|nr:hypothetical protein [Brevundimonas sp.]